MLEYDRIDISEGIDINKCEEKSARCSLCKFYYFLDKNFSYGPFLCNGYMSLKAVSMKNLKSDSHVPENFCQIKIFPSHFRKNTMICLFGV